MRSLAAGRDSGPAHFWLAERSLRDPGTLRDADRRDEATERLRRAEAAGGVAEAELAPVMARALLAGGDAAGAIPYLERAAGADPAVQIDLASA